MKTYLLLLLSAILLVSCSVQKRKYQNGYYISWHHKKSKSETKSGNAVTNAAETKKSKQQAIELHTGNNLQSELAEGTDSKSKHKFHLFSTKKQNDTCDVIFFRDGSEINAKIEEVGINEIKYKRCDIPDGPAYISSKKDIFMIKYANGTKELFKSEPAPTELRTYPSEKNTYKSNKYNRVLHPLSLPALIFGASSVISAYILLLLSLDYYSDFSEATLFIPFVLALIGIILGAVSLGQIRSQPDTYKGKGLSIPGMIMGIVMASIMLLVIAIVFTGY